MLDNEVDIKSNLFTCSDTEPDKYFVFLIEHNKRKQYAVNGI